MTFYHIYMNAYYCVLFSSRVRVRVGVKVRIRCRIWSVSGYAVVFILLPVVIFAVPDKKRHDASVTVEQWFCPMPVLQFYKVSLCNALCHRYH